MQPPLASILAACHPIPSLKSPVSPLPYSGITDFDHLGQAKHIDEYQTCPLLSVSFGYGDDDDGIYQHWRSLSLDAAEAAILTAAARLAGLL